MKVLVTGAAGYVGRTVAARLAERGHAVVAHARAPVPADMWERPPLRASFFDLAVEPEIERHLAGIDAIVHCAAALRGPSGALARDNVTAASRLAAAARGGGLAVFVHLSSVAVYGSSPPPGVNEDAVVSPDTEYGVSKADGERAVIAAFGAPAILRPGLVWGGANDRRFLRPLSRAIRSGWMVFPGPCNTPFPFTHVDNLADAVALALEGRQSGVFNITDGLAISLRGFVEILAGSIGAPAPRLTIPLRPASEAVSLADGLRRRFVPSACLPLTPSALRMMNTPCVYSIERARTRLGYAPIPREHLAGPGTNGHGAHAR